jgi:hypothetical protein
VRTPGGERADLSVPGLAAPLTLSVDLRTEKRLAIEGADPACTTVFKVEHGCACSDAYLEAPTKPQSLRRGKSVTRRKRLATPSS